MVCNRFIALMRLDKPTGIILLYIPCVWGMALTNTINRYFLIIMLVGAVIMRSVGCIINDLIDKDIDKHVVRTAQRPLASGLVHPKDAVLLVLGLLVMGGLLLWQLPQRCFGLGVGVLPLILLYPVMKRITYWPQLFLGCIFNSGVLVGYLTIQPLEDEAFILYISTIFWTLCYDTVYALQDIEDDTKSGVKSSARALGSHVIPVVIMFFGIHGVILSALYSIWLTPIWLGFSVYQWVALKGHAPQYHRLFLYHGWYAIVITCFIMFFVAW
jgi:4-hydroxybenzoate polyprenyltransferase